MNKKIITAINNSYLNEKLNEEEEFEIITKDIQYKEGIIEILEKNIDIDIIIINTQIPGNIEIEELIEKIKIIKKQIKIFLIVKDIENTLELEKYDITKIYNEKVEIIEIIKDIKDIDSEKERLIEEINNLKKLVDLNHKKTNRRYNRKKEINNKTQKIINIIGNKNSGKTSLAINIAYCLEKKEYKIVIIQDNEKSKYLFKKKIKANNIKRISNNYKNKNKIQDIISLKKNIDIIFFNKINLKEIQKLKKYDYIIIEINNLNLIKIKKEILNLILIEPTKKEIKDTKKIIEKVFYNIQNNYLIYGIINKKNKYFINKDIIKRILNNIKIIGEIKYDNLFTRQSNNYFEKNLKIEKQLKNIIKIIK